MDNNGTRKLYLKGLDGLRALCALFILLGHIAQTVFGDWGGREILSLPVPVCSAYVFFVISGFLAGYRMEVNTSLAKYYVKKAKRLLPLYYTYFFLVILIYLIFGWKDIVLNKRLLFYLFLLPEIPFCNSTGILPLVHLWFIGVLVLFYALVPFLSRVGSERRKRVSLLLAISWFLLKALSYFVFGKDIFIYRFCGVVSFDILFFSVFVGLWLRERQRTRAGIIDSGRWTVRLLEIIVWVLFLGTGFYGSFIPAPVRTEFVSILALMLIIFLQSSNPIISLENKVFRWFGWISYEIYVVQILVIILLSKLYLASGVSFPDLVIYLICCSAVVVFAWLMKKLISWFLNVSVRK